MTDSIAEFLGDDIDRADSVPALRKRLDRMTAERDALLAACKAARIEIAGGSPMIADCGLKCAIMRAERRPAP